MLCTSSCAWRRLQSSYAFVSKFQGIHLNQGRSLCREPSDVSQLRGSVQRLLYGPRENGYMVAQLECAQTGDLHKVVGCCLDVEVGIKLELHGSWGQHKDYGRQFNFTHAQRANAIGEYESVGVLETGVQERCELALCNGVDALTAGNIVEALGLDAPRLLKLEIGARANSSEALKESDVALPANPPDHSSAACAASDAHDGFPPLQPGANPHPRDERIVFDPKWHRFEIDGVPGRNLGVCSVTKFCSHFFPPFDEVAAVNSIQNSKRWATDANYAYYKKSGAEILAMWRDATQLGTRLHKHVEDAIFGRAIAEEASSLEDFRQFRRFRSEHTELVPYRSEWVLFDDELSLAGVVDMVFANADGTFSIFDWKRVSQGKLDQPAFREAVGFYPLECVPDSKLGRYALQLNLYRALLQRCYGLQENADYALRDVPILETEVKRMIAYRKLQLASDTRLACQDGGAAAELDGHGIDPARVYKLGDPRPPTGDQT